MADLPVVLLPCPFCGETPLWPEGTPGVWRRHCRAYCRAANCRGNSNGVTFATEDEAIADWNTRAPAQAALEQARAEVERLTERVEFHRAMTADAQRIAAAAQIEAGNLRRLLQDIVSADAALSDSTLGIPGETDAAGAWCDRAMSAARAALKSPTPGKEQM